MKNSRQKVEPLGASEFASTLNGDNPVAILQVLKRFTKTIRRERLTALSTDDKDCADEGDSDSSLELSDSNEKEKELIPPPTKKLKKTEIWKEDTNDYHVPFVGTAVSRGDVAQVVKGQWPTGLLQTYLTKSPLAIELTGDDWIPSSSSSIHKSLLRKKQTKISRAIYKAYLKALIELVTAAIPLGKLRDDLSSADSVVENKMDLDEGHPFHPFLPVLMKKRLPGMFHLLEDETDKGRGKPGVYGGCGSLASLALQFLHTVSRTSTPNARLVCRYMDEELSDGVLRTILRPPPPLHSRKEDDENPDDKTEDRLAKPARIEAIRLATILLQTGDSAVATYICTAGSRVRKVKTGILYVTFREGLAKHSQADRISAIGHDEDYFDAVAEMLEVTRNLIENPNLSKVVGSKFLLELFARDPLYHLSDFSLHAPSLSSNKNFEQVLDGIDNPDDDHLHALSYAGTEARRLLFLLLSNKIKSPLLANLSSKTQAHLIVNIMLRLLLTKKAGIQQRLFLLHCVNVSPFLLQELFRVLSIPEYKKSFEFLSMLRFVTMLIETGPSPAACLQQPLETLLDSDKSEILATLWPLKLQRQTIGKALQSGNSLVVLECIKCIRSSLERFQTLINAMPKNEETVPRTTMLASAFAQLLPDVQLILAVRTKYEVSSESKATSLICHGLHLILEGYARILPEQIRVSTFDWVKLLPESTILLSSTLLVQRRIVSCMHTIFMNCDVRMHNHSVSSSLFEILEIMLRTKDQATYMQCREIAQIILLPIVISRCTNEESLEYVKLELSWWLDAVTLPSLAAFCNIISLCGDDSLAVLGRSGKVLATSVETSQLNWSIVMIAALSESHVDIAFRDIVVQVATRVLLFQRNPIPFSNFIKLLEDSDVLISLPGRLLVQYTEAIINFEAGMSKERLNRLGKLVKAVFSCQSTFCTVLKSLSSEAILVDSFYKSSQAALEIARFSIHLHLISEELDQSLSVCKDVLRRTTPILLVCIESSLLRCMGTLLLKLTVCISAL